MSFVGTSAYIAPEVLLQQGYEAKWVDIFSAAVTMFVLVNGEYPFGQDGSENPYMALFGDGSENPNYS